MPWAYALPIALGVVTVVAVTVILVEVVPAFLDDLERERRDRDRRRIAGQRRMVEVQAVPQGAGTGIEAQQGLHGYEVRQRKGAPSQSHSPNAQAEQGRYEIRSPTRDSPQHVLGASEFENDDDVPLAQLSGRTTPAIDASALPEGGRMVETVDNAGVKASISATQPASTATDAPELLTAVEETLFVPNASNDSDDPFTDAHASPLLTSSKSPTLAPSSPTCDTAPLPDLLSAEEAGWVIPSTSPSIAGGSDEDGWSRLSDEDEFESVAESASGSGASRATEEWAKVHARAAAL
ncbi:hypothetical protein OF846_000600 [Rhodotorula toruloides]|nr:hypothetical protein OF846_000600 [Rhodotorula toruloides]